MITFSNLRQWALSVCIAAFALGYTNSVTAKNATEADNIYSELPFQMNKVQLPVFPDYSRSITEFGAVADGITLNTEAFDKAIKAVAEKGGGKVIVPAGLWLTGPIVLQSNINLYLEENGLRACVTKGFLDFFNEVNADVFCLQETKLQAGQIDLQLDGYHMYWNYAEKKGYSGTALFTKEEPISVTYGLGIEEHDKEGRVITAEFEDYYFVTCYTPNSKNELLRLDYRMVWEDAFREYLKNLEKTKPVIVCGDLNVAHNEIDLKNPKTNRKNAGFTDEERGKMTALLDSGFTDTFRYFYPDREGIYSWWSYRFKAREKNAGWRIDYFLTSKALDSRLVSADIHTEVFGSDHCPVELVIE